MPLKQGKSKESFSHNVAAEMHAGKPLKQSLAIAYSVKRRNARKKMAMGGMVHEEGEVPPDATEAEILKDRMIDKSADIHGEERMLHTHMDTLEPVEEHANLSHGEGHPGMEPDDQIPDSPNVVEAIMRKRKMMAEGGMVKHDAMTEEAGNNATVFEPEDDFSGHGDADLKENYASDLSDEDLSQDVVGQIIRRRRRRA